MTRGSRHYRGLWASLCLCAVFGWSLACIDQTRPLEPEDVCDAVGFAIASRTARCTGDHDLAVDRSEAFARQYTCLLTWTQSAEAKSAYRCAQQVGKLECDRVREYGGDLDQWLAHEPACASLLGTQTGHTGAP